jgi:HEAT repeat protein
MNVHLMPSNVAPMPCFKLVATTRFIAWMITFGGVTIGPLWATDQSQPIDFEGSSWIWSSPTGKALSTFPAGICFFRNELYLPKNAQVESAEVISTVDNLYVLYVNGKDVGESRTDNSAWKISQRFDIAKLLVPGRNVFAVKGVNTISGPAALLLKAVVRLVDGQEITLNSSEAWKCSLTELPNWQQLAFEDGNWSASRVVGKFGDPPWGRVSVSSTVNPAGESIGEVHKMAANVLKKSMRLGAFVIERAPPSDFVWPEGIVFLGEDCSLYRPHGATNSSADSLNVTTFNPRNSRAFPEHDLPSPMKVGRKLYALTPARPDTVPRLLLDAGMGGIGSPSVTFDGKSILFSMVVAGDPFFHIYRLSSSGGQPEQLTDGPFHDIDPAELPDGRIVFTSTRIGTFEEYHSPPARSLFVMDAEGQDLCALTHTMIFDNEPEVLADGRILFIRSDNFFDRGKVETLLHAIHPDGTEGQTEFALDTDSEYGNRLRAFHCGSPAPMPDGRVAFLSGTGITVGRLGASNRGLQHFQFVAGDVAALPDGRLLCTTPGGVPIDGVKQTAQDLRYEKIGILDPEAQPSSFMVLYDSTDGPLHSPVFLGSRPRPPMLKNKVDKESDDDVNATGFLFCQNARFTRNTTAGWSHVRAVRVLAAKGLTVRSSHSYIVHAGSEVMELGTVPLAPDGSFHIEVPANTPLSLQMVDAEGRSELNEMSWIFVRPGEQRGCVGCHQRRQSVPDRVAQIASAVGTPPLKLLGRGKPHKFRGNNAAVTGLMELQFDRYREVAGLNQYRESEDPQSHESRDVVILIEQLRAEDARLRTSAANRLSIFRNPVAAPALAKCLNDHSREVRVAATMALAVCGTRESLQPLLAALTSEEPLVAQAAAIAIENLTGNTELFDAFTSETERQRQAQHFRQWFAGTSWDIIEAELVGRLQSSDRDIVRRAAVALGHIGGNAARDALREYVMAHRGDNPHPAWRKEGHRGDAARFNSLSPVNPRTYQAATRSLGYLRDVKSIPMLAETIVQNSDPETANLFLAEAAAEALGRMESALADQALIQAFADLGAYPQYTRWYGDHDALMSCHASPLHYFITQALDTRQCADAMSIVPHLIRSVPIDPDRALFLENDDCETLVGRVIRRNGAEMNVVETCLSILGDPQASPNEVIAEAISTIHRCWAGEPTPENRAAQILSLVCRNVEYEPRIRQAFLRYREKKNNIPRLFDTGIPVVDALPIKNWVCFYLARTLGNLAQSQSADALLATLREEPTEAATGRPDPLGVGVMFLHNGLTPCWRAAVAWALGRIGDRRAVAVLLEIVADLDNATDTRYAAVEALGKIGDPTSVDAIRSLAQDYPEVSTRRALLRVLYEFGEAKQ